MKFIWASCLEWFLGGRPGFFLVIYIYFEILTVINNEKSKMRQSIDEDIIKLHEKIKKINELNFIEIVQVWRGLACYYRKLAKELPKRKDFRESSKWSIWYCILSISSQITFFWW